MNNNNKKQVLKGLAFELAVFFDIYMFQTLQIDYAYEGKQTIKLIDWPLYTIYRNFITRKYLVNIPNNGEELLPENFQTTENTFSGLTNDDNMIKKVLNDIAEVIKSEELYEEILKVLNDSEVKAFFYRKKR